MPNASVPLPADRWRAHFPVGLAPTAVDHVTVVVSDAQMGHGGRLDDFPGSAWLGRLLLGYTEGPFRDLDVTLVFNGDTFDFLKTGVDGEYPTHIDEAIALSKLRRIIAAHDGLFDALSAFCHTGPGVRRIVFLLGNHDQELAFAGVQRAISDRIRRPVADALAFPGWTFRHGDLHVEHGSQRDPMFAIEPSAPLIERDGRTLLNLPWGSVALLEVAVPLMPLLHHHDRLIPRPLLLELMPEMRDLLLGAFWRYWTRDYWQAYFAADDPLRHVSWTMLKEVVYQFGTRSMDVSVGRAYRQFVADRDDIAVCVIGHQHRPAWWSVGVKKVLRTGCYRNEFALLERGRIQALLPKVHAEVYSAGGTALRSHLVEVDGPSPPTGSIPESIFDVTEALKAALRERELAATVDRDRRAQEAQEEREARDATRDPGPIGVWRSLRRALSRR